MPCGSVNFSLTLVHCDYEVEMHALCFCQLLIDLSASDHALCAKAYIPLTLMCCAYETEIHVFCFLGLPISETPGLMDAGPDSANGFHSGVDQHRHSQCKLTCLNWQAFLFQPEPKQTKNEILFLSLYQQQDQTDCQYTPVQPSLTPCM